MSKQSRQVAGHVSTSIITDAAKILRNMRVGEVDVRPLARELGVSQDALPSLVFVSNKDKRRVFVVEFKQADTQILPDIFVENANQYKHWLQKNNQDVTIEYGLSTNGRIIDEENGALSVEAITSVTTAKELAEKIRSWVDRTTIKE